MIFLIPCKISSHINDPYQKSHDLFKVQYKENVFSWFLQQKYCQDVWNYTHDRSIFLLVIQEIESNRKCYLFFINVSMTRSSWNIMPLVLKSTIFCLYCTQKIALFRLLHCLFLRQDETWLVKQDLTVTRTDNPQPKCCNSLPLITFIFYSTTMFSLVP